MPKPQPLSFQAVIPDKDGAIKFGGGANDHCVTLLHLYDVSLEELAKMLTLRGERLYVTFMREEDVPRHS